MEVITNTTIVYNSIDERFSSNQLEHEQKISITSKDNKVLFFINSKEISAICLDKNQLKMILSIL